MNIIDEMSKKLPSIDEKNRKYVLLVMVLVIFMVFYFVGFGPQLATLNKINPELKVLTENLDQAQIDIQRESEYRKSINEYEKQFDNINQRINDREKIPQLLKQISVIANKHNVRIDQVLPRVESQDLLLENSDGSFFALPILVEARTSYHDFGRFLNELEVGDLSLTIDEMTLTANERERLAHLARITLKTIVFDEKKK
jgi:Tfp pilus assembly protein PilO